MGRPRGTDRPVRRWGTRSNGIVRPAGFAKRYRRDIRANFTHRGSQRGSPEHSPHLVRVVPLEQFTELAQGGEGCQTFPVSKTHENAPSQPSTTSRLGRTLG